MNTIRELEDALRAAPEDTTLRDALTDELIESLSWSREDAAAHVYWVWRLALDARELTRAAQLLGGTSGARASLLHLCRGYCDMGDGMPVYLLLQTGGQPPEVDPRWRRGLVPADQAVPVVVGARWLLGQYSALSQPPLSESAQRRRRRRR